MTDEQSKFSVFIDYDNLLQHQKEAGILNIVTRALIQIPMKSELSCAGCDVRIYGGWYEGTQITRLAQDVTIEIQRDFPTLIRIPKGNNRYISVNIRAELAVALLQEPGHHLFNTYRRKGKPTNIRVQDPTAVGCTDPDCVLPLLNKLLRTGNCPKSGCGVIVDDLVYRHEQKIVDTMLSCDLIYTAHSGVDHIALVSDDDDFLPPLRTVLLLGTTAVRFHPKPIGQRATFPQGGAVLHEKDL